MASQDDISNIITAFHTNFTNEGFLVLNSNCNISTMGQTLVNYQGLKIIRCKKSEIMQGDFDALKFNNICHQRCKGANPGEQLKQLFEQLKDQFPFCLISVINGENYRSTGELTTYKKGDLSVYIH